MSKDVNLVIKDVDSDTLGETSINIQWTNKGIEIHPEGTGTKDTTDGPPIFIERYKGNVRVLIWSDISQEDPTHTVSLFGAREHNRGQGEKYKEMALNSIPAKYVSVWDNGIELATDCLYDPEKHVCFDILESDIDVGNAELLDEYVRLGDVKLKAEDGVRFNY
jgi:hypothetical protein